MEVCDTRDDFAGMLGGWTPSRECSARQVVLRELLNCEDGGVVGGERVLVYSPKRWRGGRAESHGSAEGSSIAAVRGVRVEVDDVGDEFWLKSLVE